MALDLLEMIDEIENSATLTCSADMFGEDIINLLEAFDAEIIELETEILAFEKISDDYDEDDGFSDIDKIVEQVLAGESKVPKIFVKELLETREMMTDIIFGAKLLLDEGMQTCGNFGASADDSREKFANATTFIRALQISPTAQNQLLMSLAWRSSIINLLKRKERAQTLGVWDKGSVTIFDYKLQKICNDEFSPALKKAKELADEKVFAFYKAKLYENMKKDKQNEEIEK